MKKTAFTLKGIINSRNSFYLLLLLFPLFIQSCFSEKEIQASVDGNKQSFSGPSYSQPSPDKDDVGFNIAFSLLFGLMQGDSRNAGRVFNDANFRSMRNLYASNSHAPAAFYNSIGNGGEEPANLYKDKVSSGFISHLGFMGGFEFIQKKSKDGSTKITLNYFEVPIYILYQTQLFSAGNIFGGLGPYFAYGFGGNMKTSYNGQTSKTKAFDQTTGFKPFDAGLSFTAGYKIPNSFSFSLAYDIGLANIDRNAFGDKAKNRCISLNVKYPLNKLIKKW